MNNIIHTKNNNPLPCPFCKGFAVSAEMFDYGMDTWKHIVKCLDCGCRTGMYGTLEEAIQTWNTRTPIIEILQHLKKFKDNAWDEEYVTICQAIEIIEEITEVQNYQ